MEDISAGIFKLSLTSGGKNTTKNGKSFEDKTNIKPDECYIIDYGSWGFINIIEKKFQNTDGTVEEKIYASPFHKYRYEQYFKDSKYKIKYGLCINEFLYKKFHSNKNKYNHLRCYFDDNNIELFCGDDDKYFQELNEWNYINN